VDGNQTTTVTVSIADANSDDAFDPLGDQTVAVLTTDDDPQPLGPITYYELNGLDPSHGDLWYGFETTRQGFLTVVSLDAGGELRLYDGNLAPLTPGGDQRIDWQVGAGETYYFTLSGSVGPIDVRLANLVSHVGTTVTVDGTDGADQFEFAPTASRQVTINGIAYHFADAEAVLISFDAGAGNDTALLQGTSGPETFEFWPDHGELSGTGYAVAMTSVEAATANGGGGTDVALLHDSPGPDILDATPHDAKLRYDGSQDHFAHAIGFRYVHGYAFTENGGADTASLADSAATRDRFVGKPGQSELYGPAFYVRAKGFEQVAATATGPGDIATVYDSPAPDVFEATPDSATLKYNGSEEHFVQATGFRYVHGYAFTENGGADTASLADSATTRDRFVGKPGQSELYGPAFYVRAKGFEQVAATATAGGGYADVAKLVDSPWSDTFEATPEYGKLKFNNSEDHFVLATGFRSVHAYALAANMPGSIDVAMLYDSPQDDVLDITPTYIRLYNSSYYNRALDFDEVNAWATDRVFRDSVYFYDSPGDDHFDAVGNLAAFTTPGRIARAYDFTWVLATSSEGGNDTKHEEVTDYLLETVGPWIDV
ncbi:MAG: hypothetical protein ABIK89_22345, partial [Planctomycetota bacterium]